MPNPVNGWILLLLFTALAGAATRGGSPLAVALTPQAAPSSKQAQVPPGPVVGRAAPDFQLTDLSGSLRTLRSLRGESVALFFFCGCEPCHQCARTWSRMQQGKTLGDTESDRVRTVVVLTGDASAAQSFLADTGLNPGQTILLPDPQMKVALAYESAACPRVFILDKHGVLRYTNKEAGTESYKIPPLQIVTRAAGALQQTRNLERRKQ